MAVGIRMPGNPSRVLVGSLGLSLLPDEMRRFGVNTLNDSALSWAIDRAQELIQTYSHSKQSGDYELKLASQEELIGLLRTLPRFRDIQLIPETANRLGHLLRLAEPALIEALTLDIVRLSDDQQKIGGATQALSPTQHQRLLLVLVIWIAAIWLPAFVVDLSVKDQALFADWLATAALAITLTSMIKKRSS